jgi:hypothetical protein
MGSSKRLPPILTFAPAETGATISVKKTQPKKTMRACEGRRPREKKTQYKKTTVSNRPG